MQEDAQLTSSPKDTYTPAKHLTTKNKIKSNNNTPPHTHTQTHKLCAYTH